MRAVPSILLAAAATMSVSLAVAQQPIPPPVLKPFADNRDWVLMENLRYQIGQTSTVIVVPRGFVTDFASIPQAFWSFGLSAHGRYSRAAIVHDYLYWTQGCTREQADNLLMIAMKESRVDTGQRITIYEGVRLGGGQPWLNNADEGKGGWSESCRKRPSISGRKCYGATTVQRSRRSLAPKARLPKPLSIACLGIRPTYLNSGRR